MSVLKLYHNPLSTNSRGVGIAWLEKKMELQLVSLKLNGNKFQPYFWQVSPFPYVPVLADGNFHLIENLAIIDDMEAKYPAPALLPEDAKERAIARRVKMVTVNELSPAMSHLVRPTFGGAGEPEKLEKARQQVGAVLRFFEDLWGDRPFCGSSSAITLAAVVAGVSVPWLPELGVSLEKYPNLQAWGDRLNSRASWQKTQASRELVEAFKSQMKQLMKGQQGQPLTDDEIKQLRNTSDNSIW